MKGCNVLDPNEQSESNLSLMQLSECSTHPTYKLLQDPKAFHLYSTYKKGFLIVNWFNCTSLLFTDAELAQRMADLAVSPEDDVDGVSKGKVIFCACESTSRKLVHIMNTYVTHVSAISFHIVKHNTPYNLWMQRSTRRVNKPHWLGIAGSLL